MFLLLTLLHAPAAHGFTTPEHSYEGIAPQRSYDLTPQRQAELMRTDPWRAWEQVHGEGWRARFDEVTGTPIRMWGPGISVGSTDEPGGIERAVRGVFDRHAELMGHRPGDLRARSVTHVERSDRWYVHFDVMRDGIPIWRGSATARIHLGRITMLGAETYPGVRVEGHLSISTDRATTIAIEDGPAPAAQHEDVVVEPWLLPVEDIDGLRLVTTWMVRSRTSEPVGQWVAFVDATTGDLLSVHNEVRFVEGSVAGEHEPRTLDGSPKEWFPIVEIGVEGDGDATSTNDGGIYDLDVPGPFTTEFVGDYLDVRNRQFDDTVVTQSDPDIFLDEDNADPAEIAVWVFTHQIRDWGREVAPEVGMSWDDLRADVNVNDSCNAYYDGNVNFFRARGGCNNTGRIADVVFHEWGHGFHAYSYTGGYTDGSLGEGVADVVAFLQTDHNLIAPYFQENGWAIRDVAPNQVYPQDYVNSDGFVHSNGLIFGGAMWDLWRDLRDDLGEVEGTRVTTNIFTGLIKGAGGVPDTFDEAMFADDDDGNLNNGTPHLCSIIDAFGLHGLGPGGDGSFFIAAHEPLVFEAPNRDHQIALEPVTSDDDCLDFSVESASIDYRVNGGEWQRGPLTIEDGNIDGVIPGQPYGAFVEYYLTTQTAEGPFTAPTGGPINPYSFYVGDVLEINCEDFEVDNGSFSSRLVSGEDTEGADDWQWGNPLGEGGDPSFAHSGERVWGNDLGADNFNGLYQADKHNRLDSPKYTYPIHYTGVFLHYWRWLNVEDGMYDLGVIRADGEPVWYNHESFTEGEEHHEDDQWMPHAVSLNGHADDGSVKVSWSINSDGGLEFGGWNIDDVCIYAPATPDNRLGITDFSITVEEDGSVTMGWTQPPHDPVVEVKVIGNHERWPTGHDDGAVVHHDTSPVPGEATETFDPDPMAQTLHYAVYAFDGQDWLSWTRDGWNAQLAEGTSGPVEPVDDDAGGAADDELAASGGCGCATTGDAALTWPLLLGLVAVARRRR